MGGACVTKECMYLCVHMCMCVRVRVRACVSACVCVMTRGQFKEAGKGGSQQSSNSELRLSGLLTNAFTN